jgi:hypothetical protein
MWIVYNLNFGVLLFFTVSLYSIQGVRGPFDRSFPSLYWVSAPAPNLIAAILLPFLWTPLDEPLESRGHRRRCLWSATFLAAYELAQLAHLVPGRRRFDVLDLIATALGTLLAFLFGSMLIRRRESRERLLPDRQSESPL